MSSQNNHELSGPGETEGAVALTAANPDADVEILLGVPKEFCIDSEDAANWLLRKIAAARQYAIHVKNWADREIRRAEREEFTLVFLFGKQLEVWGRSQIQSLGGRRKSIFLPSGTLAIRRQPTRLMIDDDAQVMTWARKWCPEAIQVTERLLRSEVTAYFQRTGEIPPDGAHIEPEREKFSFTVPIQKLIGPLDSG